MTDPDSPTGQPVGPYATAAPAYRRSGWSPLPLPHGQKKSPPNGWTGRDGAWPSGADVQAWTEDHGSGNVALRMPPNVLGIDVDDYRDKPGAAVLDALEQQHGVLPATWTSSSRGGRSGIRFYRIPEGLRWPGVLGPGIETIRYDHRYAVAWPSLHPEGGTYRWTRPDGATALDDVPEVDELPALPAAWVEALTHGTLATDQPKADLTDKATSAWLATRSQGSPCRVMQKVLDRGLVDLTAGGSRHDAALGLTNRIAWLAGEGHTGAGHAIDRAETEFRFATADRPDLLEWERMVSGAVRLSAAAHPDLLPDPCKDPFEGLIPKENPWQSSHPSPSPSTSLTTSVASLTPSSGSPTPSETPPSAPDSNSSAGTTASALSATTYYDDNSPSPTPFLANATAASDDLTELQIRRNQAAAHALEQMRAQREAARLLEREDEDATIADRVRRKLLDDKAHLAYRAITEPPAPPFDAGTLADILARPAEPPMRIEGLMPWAGSGLVVAQRKTGKTTLLLNYARSLLTGEPFLGEFDVLPLPDDATVAFLNYEVSAAQIGRWAHEVNVPQDRLYLVNLRGRRNPLGHPGDRAALAGDLRERGVQAVVVDPFGRAFTGLSQNDNGEVQAFLIGLEQFAREEVGALDLLLATHAGWGGERSRGASALEDWGDTIITLTRDADDESRRFMKAIGRDVDIDEDEIVMDPTSRILRRTGTGSRKESRKTANVARLAVFMRRAAVSRPGASCNQLEQDIRAMDDAPSFSKGAGAAAARYGAQQGLMRVEIGPRDALLCWAVEPTSTTSLTSPDLPRPPRREDTSPPPHLPYRGGGRWEVGSGKSRPKVGLDEDRLAYDKNTGEVLTRDRDS